MITGFAPLTSCVIRLRLNRHQPSACLCVCLSARSGVTEPFRWGVTHSESGKGCVKHRAATAASQTVSMCLSRAVLQQYNQHSNALTLCSSLTTGLQLWLWAHAPSSLCFRVLGVCLLGISLMYCYWACQVNWVLKGQWQKHPCVWSGAPL